ncbi:hypothetical protein RND71_000078 [Anisodus tanguticus]|uniref:Peptidyl-prolyl cis-trans isomerase n=1 Tax=Anisodus tanguticus TaxID=243964 RepID=A0AAE1T0P4_9SOLA|nr:hypothetical protein RND71_000078 [Anisodus tanguticus]
MHTPDPESGSRSTAISTLTHSTPLHSTPLSREYSVVVVVACRRRKLASNQVRASHILIKHEGSRRKSSWKDPEGRIISNTTRDAAVSQLKAFRDDIISGKSKFEDIASRFSDCSSAKRGCDLDLVLATKDLVSRVHGFTVSLFLLILELRTWFSCLKN